MGSDHHYPEEKLARPAQVAPFRLDRHTVTNAQFAAFVEDTGDVTTTEQVGQGGAEPGSLVFHMTDGPVSLVDASQWWSFVAGACWRAPEGPCSGISGRMDHPVVQVSFEDATAYAAWDHKRLPTEAEWEFAASLAFDMREVLSKANIWRGEFPHQNLSQSTPPFTVPADSGAGRPGLPKKNDWQHMGVDIEWVRHHGRNGVLRWRKKRGHERNPGFERGVFSLRRVLLPSLSAASKDWSGSALLHKSHRVSVRA